MVKKILVAGGAGFVGSHLCDRLLDLGHTVVCVDNFHTGSPDNIAHLQNHPRFSLIEHDICHPFYVVVDQIYNLACPASPVHYQHHPIQTLKTSVYGTCTLLDLAKHVGATFLQASTSEIYGDPTLHPQPESYWGNVNPIGPRACYDEGKRCAETLCFDYHRQYGLPIKVARIFNTYGPRMHPNDGRVISNFLMQALQNVPITLYGDGMQTRSFCYVSDLVTGLVAFMETPPPVVGPLNLGNPTEFTIRELADCVRTLTQSQSELICAPLPCDDPKQRKPDITQARALLQWDPRISLEEGVRKSIPYFAAHCTPKQVLQ